MTRFEEKEIGVTIDHKTGLWWKSNMSGPMSWYKAMKLPESFGDGWRLPTVEELLTLVDYSRVNPAASFPGMPGEWFWSSSTCAGGSSSALYVSFYNGGVGSSVKEVAGYVRCVRVGPSDINNEFYSNALNNAMNMEGLERTFALFQIAQYAPISFLELLSNVVKNSELSDSAKFTVFMTIAKRMPEKNA